MKTIVLTVLATLALGLAGAAVLVCTGAVNFAADEPHAPLVGEVIETARERFIDERSKAIQVPDLGAPDMIATGARHYAPMCAGCHLAPGAPDTEIRMGLYPRPPNLSRPDDALDAARQFWIIKHGIKGTAMPAWGTSHDDAAIWSLVAFVRKLPQLSPEEYVAMTAPDEHEAHEHTHSH